MKKFRACYSGKIEELEIIKETEKQIFFISNSGMKTRENKLSNWASWHHTKEDAIDYLVSKENEEIESRLREIKYIKEKIKEIYSS
jgi:hypothetical protein